MPYSKIEANTIAQRKILLWLDVKFKEDAVKIDFLDRNRARIVDAAGDTAELFCNDSGEVSLT